MNEETEPTPDRIDVVFEEIVENYEDNLWLEGDRPRHCVAELLGLVQTAVLTSVPGMPPTTMIRNKLAEARKSVTPSTTTAQQIAEILDSLEYLLGALTILDLVAEKYPDPPPVRPVA